MVIPEHWSLSSWTTSFYFVKLKKRLFSDAWCAAEETFLSGKRGTRLYVIALDLHSLVLGVHCRSLYYYKTWGAGLYVLFCLLNLLG